MDLQSLSAALVRLHTVATEVAGIALPQMVLHEKIAQELDGLLASKQPHTIFTDARRATTKVADATDLAHPLRAVAIIDRPCTTLRQPAIDLDVSAMVMQVRGALKVGHRDGPRARDLLAIVRGVGTGKTRCLEELRAALLHDSDILPLLLTFNNWTPLYEWERRPKGGWVGEAARVAAVLSICRRMLIACYADLTLEETQKLLDADLAHALGARINDETFLLESLIVGVAIHCARRLNAKGLVLMIDETVRLCEFFGLEDPVAELRAALLDIAPASLQTALVLSALSISPLGRTVSGRRVQALVVPDRLNTELVLQKWWQTDLLLGTPGKRELRPVLLFLAELSAELPRGLERIGEKLATIMQSDNYRLLLEGLVESVVTELQAIYSCVEVPPPYVLLSALQGTPVDFLDTQKADFPKLIITSSLTNPAPPGRIRRVGG
eukprot:TRINITY_DN2147_c0_g1_i3.p1 TRINITY_DN2147_c0_g1~~TRINITY_DN2147_c0_g1_i3.p1  ORF type:complete len:440 (-),score=59.20 TRINITY_DN2147_c0_g1_i3:121-1440(-)